MEKKQTILIVDDTPENIDILVGMLGSQYKLKAAPNGEKGLKTALKNPPDLILLDIMMPVMDGFETCKQLKEHSETADVPVIFLTAKIETEDLVKGFDLGAVDYVTKPFNPVELTARINTHLQLKNTREQLIDSEKMAALGHLVAGIAHEINTPFGVIQSTINHLSSTFANIAELLQFSQNLTADQLSLFLELLKDADSPGQRLSTREERQHRRTLSSRLETMGFSNATELAVIMIDIGILEHFEKYESFFREPKAMELLEIVRKGKKQRDGLDDMKIAIERVSKLIFSLKNYTRGDFSGGEKAEVNIEKTIETVLSLYNHQIKQGVEVIRNFEPVPMVSGYEDELIQVWTNLIHNGLQAMRHQGQLEICIKSGDAHVSVKITDSGAGIPAEIQKDIFKPFFTTKPPGEGTGLGLEIVKRIVDKHKGNIRLESAPGKTAFTVSLPL
ncbi:MAG: response regulator [SAR324 cluster bacterium]|nr:response regulator [SAR324 cluster bacterium]